MSDEQAAREAIDKYLDAMRRKDAAGVSALLAKDFVHFTQPPPLRVTAADASADDGLQAWFETWDGPIGLDMPDWTYAAGEELGYGYGLSRLHGRKADGEEKSVWFRRTVCLIRGRRRLADPLRSRVRALFDGRRSQGAARSKAG